MTTSNLSNPQIGYFLSLLFLPSFYKQNKLINSNLPNVFSIPFTTYQQFDLYLYSIYPTLFFRNQFVMLKLSPLISLLSFVLESFQDSHYPESFFMFILLFFVGCCLRMLVFYVILRFRIGTLLCECRYFALYCLFLKQFIVYGKCFATLNFKYLFHAPL